MPSAEAAHPSPTRKTTTTLQYLTQKRDPKRTLILKPMATESKTPNPSDETIIAPCQECGVEIPTRGAITQIDDEGNVIFRTAFDLCDDCKSEIERRVEARRVDAARRRAKYEKTLADLINSIPKKTERQIGLDMGLD